MTNDNYKLLEDQLNVLATVLGGYNDDERKEISHFIEVGEFGLALETAFGIAVEESKHLTIEAKQLLVKLAAMMGIESEIDIAKLL